MRSVRDMSVDLATTQIGLTTIRLVHQYDSVLRDDDYLEPVWFVIISQIGKGSTTARYYDGVEARQKFDEQVSETAYRSLVGGE